MGADINIGEALATTMDDVLLILMLDMHERSMVA